MEPTIDAPLGLAVLGFFNSPSIGGDSRLKCVRLPLFSWELPIRIEVHP